jgi:hypothetical protein
MIKLQNKMYTLSNMEKSIFEEKQRFNQWWLWVLLVAVGIVPIGLQIFQLTTLQNPFSNGSAILSLVLTSFGTILVLVLFFGTTLHTKLDNAGVHVRLSPFHFKWRFYPWDTIKSFQVRTYNPLYEYGGWGIKGSKHDRAFNISGKEGLQLVFKDDNRLLIGTQKSQDLNVWLLNNLKLKTKN